MTDRPSVCLALVWHMHQPDYRDPETGVATLPWVRLHATKDYGDMAARAEAYPGVRMTFNLTPVLLEQMAALAGGEQDAYERLARRPADALTEDERLFMLRHFFMVNWERSVEPHPRYRELLNRRGRRAGPEIGPEILDRFVAQDYLDLAVLFNLAWTDEMWIRRDPVLAAMRARPSGWTEPDKTALLDAHRRILGEIVPLYRRLQDAGVIEIATSPYFHPIGPLLLDQGTLREARPDLPLPAASFRGDRDATWHLQEATRLMTALFGRRPAGLWPSEGGVSEEFLAFAGREGYRWAATDEAILLASLPAGDVPPGAAHRPWVRPGAPGPLALCFRDRTLSDLIGFVYGHWQAEAAADDFVARLKVAGRGTPPGEPPPLVSVILDGENAWEHYEGDGAPFLDALYARLAGDPDIRCVTPSEYLDRWPGACRELGRVRAGSWINGDFAIWIGHEEDRAAWDLVAEARAALLAREPDLTPEAFRNGWRSLMAAEGSDWTWWYGEEHFSPIASDFDRLFRLHLARVYRAAGLDAPPSLARPIKRAPAAPLYENPSDVLDVILDGRVTSYFEWLPASHHRAGEAGSAMHRVVNLLETIHYGADRSGNLVIRLDPDAERNPFRHTDVEVVLQEPVAGTCRFVQGPAGWEGRFTPAAGGDTGSQVDLRAACETVFEGIIRFGREAGANPVRLFTLALRDRAEGRLIQFWPGTGAYRFTVRSPADAAGDWVV